MTDINHQYTTEESDAGLRLDQFLAEKLSDHSRSRIQQWIKSGQVTVDDKACPAKTKLKPEQKIVVQAIFKEVTRNKPQPIALSIIHQDDDIIIINKPANMVVHPAAGNPDCTLLNGLLHQFPELDKVPRAGIIHRLDKDTTGLLIITRSLKAHTFLVKALEKRDIHRHYQAIVHHVPISGDTITTNIGRHPKQRTKMAVTRDGRLATTHYRILKKFKHFCLLNVMLESGRTHQIRVHMAHIHYPLVGDPLYTKHNYLPKAISTDLQTRIKAFKRQALHAYSLEFTHPSTKETVKFNAPLPDDMQQLLNDLTTLDS